MSDPMEGRMGRDPEGGAEERGPWPRISVVTPSLNQGRFLEGNIRSVLAQGYPDLEHIVVDGVSSDRTLEILRRHPHIRWISEKDRNMTEALNKGFRMATGEIIAWLNVDDRHLPGAYETVARHLAAGTGVKVLLGDTRYIEQVGRGGTTIAKGRAFTARDVIRYWDSPYFLYQPGIFFRREVLEEVGYLEEELDHAMDYEFFLRLSLRYEFLYVPRLLAEVIHHPGCKTADFGPVHAETLEVSRRYWGRRGSPRYYGCWSSRLAQRAIQAAYEAHRAGRQGEALARLVKALAVRPAVLGRLTWWSVLARACGASGPVDALKRRTGRGA